MILMELKYSPLQRRQVPQQRRQLYKNNLKNKVLMSNRTISKAFKHLKWHKLLKICSLCRIRVNSHLWQCRDRAVLAAILIKLKWCQVDPFRSSQVYLLQGIPCRDNHHRVLGLIQVDKWGKWWMACRLQPTWTRAVLSTQATLSIWRLLLCLLCSKHKWECEIRPRNMSFQSSNNTSNNFQSRSITQGLTSICQKKNSLTSKSSMTLTSLRRSQIRSCTSLRILFSNVDLSSLLTVRERNANRKQLKKS